MPPSVWICNQQHREWASGRPIKVIEHGRHIPARWLSGLLGRHYLPKGWQDTLISTPIRQNRDHRVCVQRGSDLHEIYLPGEKHSNFPAAAER